MTNTLILAVLADMDTFVAVVALQRAFEEVAPLVAQRQYEDNLALQPLVFAVVDEMKASGELPERVLVTIRSQATAAGITHADALMSEVIRWCVERYFPKDIATP